MKIFYSFKGALSHSRKGEFLIFHRGVLFPFKWDYKGKKNTVVFFPGRTSREYKPIPTFQRSSYFDSIDANVISCFDPTLFWSKDLSLAWFQGRSSLFYGSILGELLAKAVKTFKSRNEDILLYGTSGGGIPGFNVAMKIPGCTLYVSNIQTDASRYHHKFFRKMADISYPRMTDDEIINKETRKISVFNINEEFNLVYTQNESDEFHYKNHFKPYFEKTFTNKKIKKTFYLYDDIKTGHDPLPRETELSIINSLIQRKPISELLPNCKEIFQVSP